MNEIVKQETTIQVNPETLIMSAIDKGLPVETMERLLAMRKELNQERAKEAFFKALADFQNECPIIEKTKPVKDKNGVIKYYYAPIDDIIKQVKSLLDKNGFSYTYKTLYPDGRITVICEAHHIAGHTEPTDITVPIGSDYMSAQQQVGAALSFAKRYAFCDAFGILTGDEDDDCQPVVNEKKPETKKTVHEIAKEKFPEMRPDQKKAKEIVEKYIKDGLITVENVKADIRLALQTCKGDMSHLLFNQMTEKEVIEVMATIDYEVELKQTGFNPEPVNPEGVK